MKICWDNLERVRLTREGNLKISTGVYIEMDACKVCGEPCLVQKASWDKAQKLGKPVGPFCSQSCAKTGKTHPIEVRRKIAERSYDNQSGSLHPNYKGGIKMLGLTMYDTHKDSLGPYEEIRKQENTGILEVKCAYCNQWYIPDYSSVRNRLSAINNQGGMHFYCSENCKLACPTFGRVKYPKGFKHTTSREVSTYLRKMVLERDSWTCQICGKTIAECQLHVHHMDPVAQNPMFQNDMDSCITLCKGCHKMVHSRKGCRYIDLVCKGRTNG